MERNLTRHEVKLLRIAEAYGLEKKRGYAGRVADKLQTTSSTVSGWKNRGVPDEILARVVRETGASFHYLDAGEGEIRPPPQTDQITVRESPGEWSEERLHLLDLWDGADPISRKNALMILESSAKESRQQDGGGSDLAEANSA
jgi:hypothetical protein